MKNYPKWISIIWYCVDCMKLSDRIRDCDLKPFSYSLIKRKLYRHSNRVNEKGWIHVAYYNIGLDKVDMDLE